MIRIIREINSTTNSQIEIISKFVDQVDEFKTDNCNL